MTKNRNVIINSLRIVMIAVACIAMASCSSNRKNIAPIESTQSGSVLKAPQIADLAEAYHDWENFYAPFTIRMSQPMSFSFSGRATMEYGKAINLSLRMLGMEVGVIYLDNDSAIILDKFHKYYLALPLSSLTSRTSITLADIQSILLGQAVYPGQGPLSHVKKPQDLFSSATEGEKLILTPKRNSTGATWYLTLSPGPVLQKITIEPSGFPPFNATFAYFVNSVAGAVASDINIAGEFNKKKIDAEIEWSMNKAEWNSGRTIQKPNFSGYKKLDATDFIKAMGNK